MSIGVWTLFVRSLQEMLKCNKGERTAELEEALATVLDIIKSVNDSLHQIAITGFEVSHMASRLKQPWAGPAGAGLCMFLLRIFCIIVSWRKRGKRGK